MIALNRVAEYRYDPFGQTTYVYDAMTGYNLYRFSSKLVHPNSGMYCYGYGFYDPSIQRWINWDPLGESGFEVLRRHRLREHVRPQAEPVPLELLALSAHLRAIGSGTT